MIAYLGYDPFIKPELGRPKRNETTFVAILRPNEAVPIGVAIWRHRMEVKKTRKLFAKELGWPPNRFRLGKWADALPVPIARSAS